MFQFSCPPAIKGFFVLPVVVLMLVVALGLHQLYVAIQWQQSLVAAHAKALSTRPAQKEALKRAAP